MATIIIEDGSIIANANSYVSEAELTTYATDRGITLAGVAAELIIKSMDYIEGQSYLGSKYTAAQSLQWPRSGVTIDGFSVGTDEVPDDLKNAQLATAVSIDQGDDPLATIERSVKKEKVGDIEVEYSDGAASRSISVSINNALSKLTVGGSGVGAISVWRV